MSKAFLNYINQPLIELTNLFYYGASYLFKLLTTVSNLLSNTEDQGKATELTIKGTQPERAEDREGSYQICPTLFLEAELHQVKEEIEKQIKQFRTFMTDTSQQERASMDKAKQNCNKTIRDLEQSQAQRNGQLNILLESFREGLASAALQRNLAASTQNTQKVAKECFRNSTQEAGRQHEQ
jgi:hypothetical protein